MGTIMIIIPVEKCMFGLTCILQPTFHCTKLFDLDILKNNDYVNKINKNVKNKK